jgi:hypothetical protein
MRLSLILMMKRKFIAQRRKRKKNREMKKSHLQEK